MGAHGIIMGEAVTCREEEAVDTRIPTRANKGLITTVRTKIVGKYLAALVLSLLLSCI